MKMGQTTGLAKVDEGSSRSALLRKVIGRFIVAALLVMMIPMLILLAPLLALVVAVVLFLFVITFARRLILAIQRKKA